MLHRRSVIHGIYVQSCIKLGLLPVKYYYALLSSSCIHDLLESQHRYVSVDRLLNTYPLDTSVVGRQKSSNLSVQLRFVNEATCDKDWN